jgi:hypothetical protein
MFTDSPNSDGLLDNGRTTAGLKFIAAVSALLITAVVMAGYAYLRQSHTNQGQSAAALNERESKKAKIAPKAHIVVDEAMLKGGRTLLGGTVKNISADKLSGLVVELELRRRNDGTVEEKMVALEPADLEPQQEGRYALNLPAQDFSSGRLSGLKATINGEALAYTTAAGQRRPPERLESKTIVVPKRSSKSGEFLNSPDNPVRVP